MNSRLSSNSTVGSWKDHQVTLQCVAIGVSAPTFQWYDPDNTEITTNIVSLPDGSRVRVTTTDAGDYGQYNCRATNVVGITDHSILVKEWSKYHEKNSGKNLLRCSIYWECLIGVKVVLLYKLQFFVL